MGACEKKAAETTFKGCVRSSIRGSSVKGLDAVKMQRLAANLVHIPGVETALVSPDFWTACSWASR
jgi:hypothetical protein